MEFIKQQITEIIEINSEFPEKRLNAEWMSYDKNVHKVVVPVKTQSGIEFQMDEVEAVLVYLKYPKGSFGPFEGKVEDEEQRTVSFEVPDEVRGQTGTVNISVMLNLSGGRQVDLVKFTATARLSAVDSDAPEMQKYYLPMYEDLVADIEVQKEKFDAASIYNKAEIDNKINPLDISLKNKVDKDGAGQISWGMADQEFREQVLGNTPPAVVGKDSVLTENIVDGVVTQSKLGFSPYNKLSFQKANFNTEEYCGFDKNGNYTITKDAAGQILHNYRIYADQNGLGQAVRVVAQHIDVSETTRVFLGMNENIVIFANLVRNQTGNYNIEFHLISRGQLTVNIFPTLTDVTDIETVRKLHSITLRQIGNYLAVYFNETLIQIINSKTYLGSQFSVSGTNYRGTFNSWVSRVRTIFAENAISPYMHMSIDDVNSILRDIHDNRATYTSIFDNANLAFLKSMHEKYGIVVSLYLFKSTSSFDISNMTSKYRDEFADNAHWLKLGFHSRESGVNYNETDSATLIADYTSVVNAIYTFAVPANLDVIPRFENFGVSLANQKALLASGQPFEGTYGADDSRDLNAGLTGNALTLIQNTDYYFDPKLQLYYPRSETRMDSATSESIVSQLNILSRNVANNRVFGMFWHQGAELRAGQRAAIESAAKWAVDHQIRFDFPQNNKPTL